MHLSTYMYGYGYVYALICIACEFFFFFLKNNKYFNTHTWGEGRKS